MTRNLCQLGFQSQPSWSGAEQRSKKPTDYTPVLSRWHLTQVGDGWSLWRSPVFPPRLESRERETGSFGPRLYHELLILLSFHFPSNTWEKKHEYCGAGEDSLDSKEVKSVNHKGNQPCIYSLEGLILKLKLQYFGHLMRRADSLRKDPDAGKDWGWEEMGAREDEMVGWHHQLNGHEFEQTLGDGEGQGSMPCCSSCGLKESDTV